jgi:hypothetical protein
MRRLALALGVSCLWAGPLQADFPGGPFAHIAVDEAYHNVPMVMGTDGLPFLAYHEESVGSNETTLRATHCSDPVCSTSATTMLASRPSFVSMTLGSDGLPLIAYVDSWLYVVHCSNVPCTTATTRVLDNSGQVLNDTSIALGPDGRALISYSDFDGPLKVAHCSDAACTGATVTVVGDPGARVFGASMTVGADGFALIAYYTLRNGLFDLVLAHCQEADCSTATTTVLETSFTQISRASVAIGTDGLGLLAYGTSPSGGPKELRISHCQDVACTSTTATTFDLGGDSGLHTAIAIGADGLPLVTSTRKIGPFTTQVMLVHCGSPTCTTDITMALLADVGNGAGFSSIVIRPDGRPLIAYVGHDPPSPGEKLWVAHQLARGDFSGDGRPDLVWRHELTGDNLLWFMNGATRIAYASTNPSTLPDAAWRIVGTNDFDLDGKTDLLWRHAVSGQNVVWFMNGVNLIGGTFTTPSALTDTRWQMVGTGDFDRDGYPDVLWRHAFSGENVLWYMNGTTLASGTFLTPASLPDTRWKMAGVADFNRDGEQDILWHHSFSGEVVLWYMNGSVLSSGTFTTPSSLPDTRWSIAAVGDYDANGNPDIVWHNDFSGETVLWFMNGATLASGTFTNPSTFPDTNWKVVGPR